MTCLLNTYAHSNNAVIDGPVVRAEAAALGEPAVAPVPLGGSLVMRWSGRAAV